MPHSDLTRAIPTHPKWLGAVVLGVALIACGADDPIDTPPGSTPSDSQEPTLPLPGTERDDGGDETLSEEERSFGLGGVTGDFGGNPVACSGQKLELPGDPPALAISVDEVLLAATGNLTLPIRWLSPCTDPEAPRKPPECQNPDSIVHGLSGTETTLHFDVTHTGEPARVRYRAPDESEPVCGQALSLPLQLQLRTEDGVLDEQLSIELGTTCGHTLGLNYAGQLSGFQGQFAQSSGALDTLKVEVHGEFFRNRFWFNFFLTQEGSPGSLLTVDLPPFGEGNHDVSRSEAGLADGLSLNPEECRSARKEN